MAKKIKFKIGDTLWFCEDGITHRRGQKILNNFGPEKASIFFKTFEIKAEIKKGSGPALYTITETGV